MSHKSQIILQLSFFRQKIVILGYLMWISTKKYFVFIPGKQLSVFSNKKFGFYSRNPCHHIFNEHKGDEMEFLSFLRSIFHYVHAKWAP
jgi:hypothetical protein